MDYRAVVVIYSRIVIFVEQSCLNKLTNGFMSQIRVDRTGSVAEQGCKMMNLSRLAALQDHCHGSSLLRAHQMLLQTGYCQQ